MQTAKRPSGCRALLVGRFSDDVLITASERLVKSPMKDGPVEAPEAQASYVMYLHS